MKLRALFVSNGHGETAIAARIGRELARDAGGDAQLDLFAAVGTGAGAAPLHVVGPHRAMPSGGLVAMGNLRAFARDLRAGFLSLFAAQVAFLRAARGRYDVVIAVGDVYALGLALLTRSTTIYVGTAKSVYVAPYGPFERVMLRRAQRVFVRDEPTADFLRERAVAAEAPGNTIADLASTQAPLPGGPWIGVIPGSRADAAGNAVRLARVLRSVAARDGTLAGLLSIAPTVPARLFEDALVDDGWEIATGDGPERPFVAHTAGARLVAWNGDLGALLASASVVIGAAGTANEQAAARGVPVVVLDDRTSGMWYRMRQRRLLGEALLLVADQPEAAATELLALLHDPERLRAMGAAGRARIGPAGGSAAIARAIREAAA